MKLFVDILMSLFVILSLIRWSGDPIYHIITGSVFTFLFIAHFLLNVKIFSSMTKKLQKLNVKMKLKYAIDVILLVMWITVVTTGVIATVHYYSIDTSQLEVGRLHGVLGRVGCGFIFIHIIQHLKQIRSYFKRKRSAL